MKNLKQPFSLTSRQDGFDQTHKVNISNWVKISFTKKIPSDLMCIWCGIGTLIVIYTLLTGSIVTVICLHKSWMTTLQNTNMCSTSCTFHTPLHSYTLQLCMICMYWAIYTVIWTNHRLSNRTTWCWLAVCVKHLIHSKSFLAYIGESWGEETLLKQSGRRTHTSQGTVVN